MFNENSLRNKDRTDEEEGGLAANFRYFMKCVFGASDARDVRMDLRAPKFPWNL